MSFRRTLLTTAAITALTVTPVLAEEETQQGWWGSMVDSVQAWYYGDTTEGNQDVEEFLDEVTIVVPPMTEDAAAMVEPAAGGEYQETLEEALEREGVSMDTEVNTNIDETTINEVEQQSYNTGFTNTAGSVAAFDNPDSYRPVEELAEIVPAAGDAEGINDEAIVPTKVDEKMADAEKAMDDQAAEDKTMVESMMDNAADAASAVSESVTDLANEAAEGTKNMLESADESIKDGMKNMDEMVGEEE